MKNIISYLSLALLAIFGGCSDNENWTIVTDVQPGVYITGSATVYSGAAPASALKVVKLDGDPKEYSEIVGIYTWLKSSGEFKISMVSEINKPVEYGKGEVVTSGDAIEIAVLTESGEAFKVAKDGLYNIVVNTTLKQINILPVKLGAIGAATPQGWGGESTLGEATFDENALSVTYSGNIIMSPGEYKFRYSGDWGYHIDYDGTTKARLYTDLGLAGNNVAPLTEGGFSELKPGGKNISTEIGGEFEFTIKYDIRSRTFNGTYKMIGEPVLPPDLHLPGSMFIIGSPYDWNWDNSVSLIPVNGHAGTEASPDGADSKFWMIKYFNADDAIKFNTTKAWDGGEFGYSAATDAAKTLAELSDEGGNIKIGKAGWYIVVVTINRSEDEKSYVRKVNFLAPEVYALGNTVGTWDVPNSFKFSIPEDGNREFVSPAFTAADELRMSIKLDGIDWWRTEFIILDGKIIYRGNDGDQARVKVEIGQKAYLKFSDGTGTIK